MHEIESSAPPELTDEQRGKIREYFDTNPDGGYKNACKAAGLLRLTKGEARALVEADPDLAEHRERKLGIDEDSAWKRVGAIAANTEHKDALRANTFILAAIHGRTDQTSKVEVTGAGGGPIKTERREVSLTGVLHVLAEAGALPDELAGPLRHLAATRDALPAQPD